MPRADLLALTPDDLASLTNRGTVKRAQKELDAGEFSCEILDDEAGDLVVNWSDGIVCRFPGGRTVHDAICSSGLAGISRHIVRSVLAYQTLASTGTTVPESPSAAAPASPPSASAEASRIEQPSAIEQPPSGQTKAAQGTSGHAGGDAVGGRSDSSLTPGSVWDPGSISDDCLIAHFRKPAITQARKRFEQGVIVELTRGAKPAARFWDAGCTVRFLVPGDLRYVSADCAESLLSTWVPMAVWAFRELPADRLAGLLCLQQADLPVPDAVLDIFDGLLSELCRDGLAGVAESWPQRLGRVEKSLREEGLVWPAELAVDLLNQCEMYRQHDARFEPRRVVEFVGESIVRMRAIRSGTRAVPQPLIRGTKADRPAEIAGGRMIGIGLGIQPGRGHTTVSSYLQDTDSGSVVAVQRTFADPDPASGERPRAFADLAGTVLVRGVSLADLATSQLLLKSGKRTPGGVLLLPRTASSLTTHPQTFQWEQLKPPLAAESFAQLAARLESLPPASVRPRRCTENLHVVAVAGVDEVIFDIAHQQLSARLRDELGGLAKLVHPFHARGREGFDHLLRVLQQRGGNVRFVCGHIRLTGRMLEVRPVCLIVDDGERRLAIQPWLPAAANDVHNREGVATEESPNDESVPVSPVDEFRSRLEDQLSDLLLTGLGHSSVPAWSELQQLAQRLGLVRLAKPIAGLAETLSSRAGALRWDPEDGIARVKDLCLLARLASEL